MNLNEMKRDDIATDLRQRDPDGLKRYMLDNGFGRQSDMTKEDWINAHETVLGGVVRNPVPATETKTETPAPAPAPVIDLESILSGMRGFGMDKTADNIEAAVASLEAERDKAKADAQKAVQNALANMPTQAAPVVPVKPGAHATTSKGKRNAGELFPGSRSLVARGIMVDICDYPGGSVDPNYLWQKQTPDILAALVDGENILISGSKGVGKSSFARNLAALLGRPYIQIGFHAETSSADLFGFMGPDASGGMSWVPGDLLDAMQTPFAIVDLSEISFARPELIPQLFSVLETSDRTVRTADGVTHHVDPTVWFIATSNDNGTGEQSHKYHGTQALNPALVSRFGWRVEFTAPEPARLAKLISKQAGVSLAAGQVLADFEKAMADGMKQGNCGDTPGIRALLSWAKAVKRGTPSPVAFEHSVLNGNPQDDAEYWAQQALAIDPHSALEKAVNGAPDPAPQDDDTSGPDLEPKTRAGFGEL